MESLCPLPRASLTCTLPKCCRWTLCRPGSCGATQQTCTPHSINFCAALTQHRSSLTCADKLGNVCRQAQPVPQNAQPCSLRTRRPAFPCSERAEPHSPAPLTQNAQTCIWFKNRSSYDALQKKFVFRDVFSMYEVGRDIRMPSLEAGPSQPKASFPVEWLGLKLPSSSSSSRLHHTVIHQWTCSKQEEVLVVVGGGAAGIFGAIRAKALCPSLNVLVLEQNQLLAKVKISGGGRCNVTTALFENPLLLAEQYPRGHKELRGSFFRLHGPTDTVSWFTERGVVLKTEEDGRMFPASNTSSTIIDCLLTEAHKLGVLLQAKSLVSKVLQNSDFKFDVCTGGIKLPSSTIKADYLLLATGGTPKGFNLAKGLGHSVIDPRPSLFTFKVADSQLQELAGVSFPLVHAELQVKGQKHKNPRLTQAGPMLITHWGLSGPVVLRLSAWGARDLFSADYQGILWIDFEPKLSQEDISGILDAQRKYASKKKLGSFAPSDLSLVRRFWEYLLLKVEIDPDKVWATLNTGVAKKLAALIKRCPFRIDGKGEFKDEFVTSGGVPLVEVDLNSMESRICPCLYLAGEVLNVDGVTGGFNFQNAWTGGFIAGTSVGSRSNKNSMKF